MRRFAPHRRTIRIGLVAPSMALTGGQSIQARRLLAHLRSIDGVDAELIVVNPELPVPFRWLQGIRYVRTIVTTAAYVLTLVRRIPRCDVVHAFSASYWSYLLAPLPALVVARVFGRATVLNYRSGEADDHLGRWRRTAAPTMRRFADAIVVPSGYLVGVFARHGLPARAIPNFVEDDAIPFRHRQALRPVFLSNRNLEPLYDVGCTIRAFERIRTAVPGATLLVAGEGRERPALEALVRQRGIGGVTFLGRVAPGAMPGLYAQADVYLNSPVIDNMPGSIIEAFAAGLPVVTTDAGGIPFMVTHELTGLMVPRGDDAALAAAALRLFSEPGLAARLSANGHREVATRYSWNAVRRAWVTLYESLVPGTRIDVSSEERTPDSHVVVPC